MHKFKQSLLVIPLITLPFGAFANTLASNDFIAISVFLGGRYSDDLTDLDTEQEANFDNSGAQAIALSWHYDQDAEGELFYSNAKQTVTVSSVSADLDISYLHFGGRLHFVNNTPFSTSVGLGIGATFFIPDASQYDNEVALSGSISFGARYQLSQRWALKTDFRAYATVQDNNSSLICEDNQCLIDIDAEAFLQVELMAGIEFRF